MDSKRLAQKFEDKLLAADVSQYGRENTQAAQLHQRSNSELADVIREVAKYGDIKLAIQCEMAMDTVRGIKQDISQQEANSNKATAKQGLAALQAYDNMKANPNAYKKMSQSLSDKDLDKSSLPKDAGRNFIQSHIKRLDNRLTASNTPDEREVLEARKSCMSSIRQEYMKEQKEALDIPHDKKASQENIEKGNALRTMPLEEIEKKYPDLKNEVTYLKLAEQQASNIKDADVRAASIDKFRSFVAERYDNNEKFE